MSDAAARLDRIAAASGTQWTAWYAGYATYDSRGWRWDDLPARGILGVLVWHGRRVRGLVCGGDYYGIRPVTIYTDGPDERLEGIQVETWRDAPGLPPGGKWGVWVDDREMGWMRAQAALGVQWPRGYDLMGLADPEDVVAAGRIAQEALALLIQALRAQQRTDREIAAALHAWLDEGIRQTR